MKSIRFNLKKRILAILLSLAVFAGAFSALPVISRAVEYTDWKDLEHDLINGAQTTCTLGKDLIASAYRDPIRIKEGENVTLDLNGHTLSRNLSSLRDSGHVLVVQKGATLTIKDSSGNNSGRITGGYSKDGSGIYVYGTLNFEGGTVTGNNASGNGAGIYVKGGTVNFSGGVISDNKAERYGAGIFCCENSTLNITGGTIRNNSAALDGGGIHLNNSVAAVENAEINNNSAKNGGGLFVTSGSTCTLTDSFVSADKANERGGGISVQGKSTLEIKDSTVSSNSASYDGGGIYTCESSVLTMDGTAVQKNNAKWGAGIYLRKSKTDIKNAEISGNNASDAGGGVFVIESKSNTISDSTIQFNSASSEAGGIKVSDNASIDATGCTIGKNTAKTGGGIVLLEASHFEDCIIKENKTTGQYNYPAFTGCGGGVWINIGENKLVRFDRTVFLNNTASGSGGGILAQGNGQLVLHECDVKGNHADLETGGIKLFYTKTAFLGAEIRQNTAKSLCGGVEATNTIISMKGYVVIRDNETTSGYPELADLLLSGSSYIKNPALYQRSYIHLAANTRNEYVYVKDISKYQQKYFHIDTKEAKFTANKKVDTPIYATLFGNGSWIIVLVIVFVACAVAVTAVIFKKKGGAISDDDDEEE